MNRKAQGLSLNVIVLAAIAILVLLVLLFLLLGGSGSFRKGVSTCNGVCQSVKSSCSSSSVPIPMENCDATGDGVPEVDGSGYCCLSFNNK